MYKPNIKKMYDRNKELPPIPPIFEKEKLIAEINSKLVEENAGPNHVVLMDMKNPRRTWISYEYHLDVTYKIGDKEHKLIPNNFFDNWNYYETFEQQLYNKLALQQVYANNDKS